MVANKTSTTIFWSGIEQFSSKVSNFIITIILARILAPNDYGLVAMLGIFFSFSQALIDSGFASSLVQKGECTEDDYSTVFYFNIIISILIYLILYFSSPLIAKFYNNDLLINLTKVYSINLIINAFGFVHRIMLVKQLKFKTIAQITMISSLLSGIGAIFAAYNGFGYWALVVQIMLSSLLSTILFILSTRWTPMLLFSFNALKSLSSFGLSIMFLALFNSIYTNLYSLYIGHKFNTRDLGLFNRSQTFSMFIPISISDFVMKAIYPIEVQYKENIELLRTRFKEYLYMMMLVVISLSTFVSVYSYDIVTFLLSDKWIEIVPLLQIMSIAYIFTPIVQLNWNILKVRGCSKDLLKSELIKKILGILIMLITVQWGIFYMVVGLLVYAVIDMFISTIYVKREINLGFIKQLLVILPIFIYSATASVISYIILKILGGTSYDLFLAAILYFTVLIGVLFVFGKSKLKTLLVQINTFIK